jgi:hypothetical protein
LVALDRLGLFGMAVNMCIDFNNSRGG